MSSPIETYRALILADVVSASEGSFFVGLAEEGLNSFVQGRDVKIFMIWCLLKSPPLLIQMLINLDNSDFVFLLLLRFSTHRLVVVEAKGSPSLLAWI